MKIAPKITIITPSFNQGRFIEQTIKSVVSQSYPNIEYLIFDGGSTDDSLSIIKRYAKKYPFIKWQSEKDKGQVDAINKGLKKASGDIIAYINSDDYYTSKSFQKVANFFNKNQQKNWLVGNCLVTEKKLRWTFYLKSIWPIDRHLVFLEIFNTINQPSLFLRKELVNRVGLFNEKYHYAFDYDYWLRCTKYGLPGRIKDPLSVFRIHNDSKGNTGYRKQFTEDIKIAKNFSKNPLVHFLHFIAQQLTFAFYSFLK